MAFSKLGSFPWNTTGDALPVTLNQTGSYTTAQPEVYPILETILYLTSMYLWIIPIVIGVPGNLLALIVTSAKENRNLSTCYYMSMLAIADTVFLVNETVVYVVMAKVDLGGHTHRVKEVVYQFMWYIVHTPAIMSGLFLAGMSVDRLIAVRFPLKATTMCTRSRAKKVCLATGIFITIAELHFFLSFRYFEDPNTGNTMLKVSVPESYILEMLAVSFQMIFGTVIPFLIIICSNVVIIITVRKAAANRKSLTTGGKDQEVDTAYLTRMLILVVLAYLFTSIPFRFYEVVMELPQMAEIYDLSQKYWYVRFYAQYYLAINLWNYNGALNFYLYLLAGGKKYRGQVKRIFNKAFCSKTVDK